MAGSGQESCTVLAHCILTYILGAYAQYAGSSTGVAKTPDSQQSFESLMSVLLPLPCQKPKSLQSHRETVGTSWKMPSAFGIIDHSPQQPEPEPPVPTASNLVLIDNYDSFTWNIYQYLVLEGATVHVFRNDQITLEELIQKNPTQLIISPGPGHPATDSGISRDAIRHFAGKVPIFGVCMGL